MKNLAKTVVLVAAGLAVAGVSALAVSGAAKTFRTTGFFIGVAQGNSQVTGTPEIDEFTFPGRGLVNLAMGRDMADKTVTNQVLALTMSCDLSSASLVVFDKTGSNILSTIAASTSVDSVKDQDRRHAAPNRARFVAQFQVGTNGSASEALLGGYLTVAGHVHLDPATGCPEPVLVSQDHDPVDHLVCDKETPGRFDPDSDRLVSRVGLAHLIGVLRTVNAGVTNVILVPHGNLSIRRELSATAAQ